MPSGVPVASRSYRRLIMVTTLAPCWYAAGLVRAVWLRDSRGGESRNFREVSMAGSLGVEVIDLDSEECALAG